MTFDEAATLLGLAAARDNRKPSQAMASAWSEDLEDIPFDLARRAVSLHFRESTEYLMPVHVRAIVTGLKREQHRIEREAREERLGIEAGEVDRRALKDLDPKVKAFVAGHVAKFALPEADRIHQLALKRARDENGRPEKPHRSKPTKSKREQLPDPATDEIAAYATRYLIDGYEPKDVSERFGVSRKWCEKTARRFTPKESK